MATIVVLYYDPRVSFYPSVCAAVVFFCLMQNIFKIELFVHQAKTQIWEKHVGWYKALLEPEIYTRLFLDQM